MISKHLAFAFPTRRHIFSRYSLYLFCVVGDTTTFHLNYNAQIELGRQVHVHCFWLASTDLAYSIGTVFSQV